MPCESVKRVSNIQIYLITFLLLTLDLVIAAARTGLLNARLARLLSMGEKEEATVNHTVELVKRRSRLRASLKLTQAMLRFLMAGLVLSILIPWESTTVSTAIVSGTLVLTAILIWLVEFFVERQVLNDPENWALRLTPLARLTVTLLSPLLALPLRLSQNNDPAANKLVTISEEELKSLVDASQQQGLLQQEEHMMIHSIFELGDTLVREIMIPRIDMFTLDVNTKLEDVIDDIIRSGYSRIPVYEEQIDNILGHLYTKDLLKVWRRGNEIHTLKTLLRPAKFIPEAKKVDELLAEMQADRIHIAMVIDEYGGVAGLVTLEDIIEEIFGEIRDEYDQGEELPYQQMDEGVYLFSGRIDLDDFNKIMDSDLPTTEADTLGGLIYTRTGRVPKVGERLQENGLLLTVEQVSERRIRKVRARRIAPPAEDQRENAEEHNHANR